MASPAHLVDATLATLANVENQIKAKFQELKETEEKLELAQRRLQEKLVQLKKEKKTSTSTKKKKSASYSFMYHEGFNHELRGVPSEDFIIRRGGLFSSFEVVIDTSEPEIAHPFPLSPDVYSCNFSGWNCACQEIYLPKTKKDGDQEDFLRSFVRIVDTLESLPAHPNIARFLFHQFSRSENLLRLYTQSFDKTLAFVIRQHDRSNLFFPVDDVLNIMIDVVNGLMFLHQHSLIHRELDTEHLFVTLNSYDDVSKVMLGGLVSATKSHSSYHSHSRLPPLLSRPTAFTAPEILNCDDVYGTFYNFSADAWSLGMVLYELLTLKSPYSHLSAEKKEELMHSSIMEGRRPPLPFEEDKPLNSENEFLVALFLDCTSLEPTHRPELSMIKDVLVTKQVPKKTVHKPPSIQRRMSLGLGGTPYAPRNGRLFEHFLVLGHPQLLESESTEHCTEEEPNTDSPEDEEEQEAQILFSFPLNLKEKEKLPPLLGGFCFPSGLRTYAEVPDFQTHQPTSSQNGPQNSKLAASLLSVTSLLGISRSNSRSSSSTSSYHSSPRESPNGSRISVTLTSSDSGKHLPSEILKSGQQSLSQSQGQSISLPAVSAVLPRHSSRNQFIFIITHEDTILYGVCVYTYLPLKRRKRYSPVCLCLLTRFPFFSLHYTFIYTLLDRKDVFFDMVKKAYQGGINNSNDIIKMLYGYHAVPVPKQGESISFDLPSFGLSSDSMYLPFSFEVCNDRLMFHVPKGHMRRFLAYWAVPSMFRFLSLSDILTLWTCILLELHVVIISHNPGILSASLMSIIPLIRPFVWQGGLLTWLPQSLEECLQAPVPYIFGMEDAHLIPQNSQIVIVDLDKNYVHVPRKINLPELPNKEEMIELLTKSWVQLQNDKDPYVSPYYLNEKEFRAIDDISKTFYDYHVELIKKICNEREHLKMDLTDPAVVEEVIQRVPVPERPFFKMLLATQYLSFYFDNCVYS